MLDSSVLSFSWVLLRHSQDDCAIMEFPNETLSSGYQLVHHFVARSSGLCQAQRIVYPVPRACVVTALTAPVSDSVKAPCLLSKQCLPRGHAEGLCISSAFSSPPPPPPPPASHYSSPIGFARARAPAQRCKHIIPCQSW
ncbi:hypothetical protein Baya_13248 [Bagarius yarrelli]|uniref:Uncharacterized protein n=1 Tax=Bagarius yarrelli TaxID=175774 RepID=A0A556V578_BAGYA|nr:hypothetical protein Baya_13248 [Bagarius yarrelli]